MARVGPAPSTCRIEAVRAESLTVAPPRGDSFLVAVSDGALSFVPTEDDRSLHAEVEQPLAFRAQAPSREQRLALAADVDLAAGSVRAARGSAVLAIARAGDGVVARLKLGRRSALDTRGVELAVGPVAIDCAHIAADAEPIQTSAHPRHVPGGELYVASMVPLVVRPLRAAPLTVEVRAGSRGGFVPVWVVDRRGHDARIVIAFSDDSRIAGWVPRNALRAPSAAESETIERLISQERPASFELDTLGELGPRAVPHLADGYVGPATLRSSSAIAAAPGDPPWARSADRPLEVQVRWERGSPHVELIEIPGMWIPEGRAWAERPDVSLPDGP